jgi:hypothetical protein
VVVSSTGNGTHEFPVRTVASPVKGAGTGWARAACKLACGADVGTMLLLLTVTADATGFSERRKRCYSHLAVASTSG